MSTEALMIHSFVTDGYVPYAELFLEALRFHYGEQIFVRLDGWNLSQEQIQTLKRIYTNIEIHNILMPIEELAEILGVTQEKALAWKRDIELGIPTEKNYLYKIFISVNKRYRSMDGVVDQAKHSGYKYLLHVDIDIYFRSRFLESLLEIMEEYDFVIYMNKAKSHTAKVLGAFLGFNLQNNIDFFVKQWMKEIDSVPFYERWKGFGQSVLWFAIQHCAHVRVGDLSTISGSPRRSDTFDPSAHFWQSSHGKMFLPLRLYYSLVVRCSFLWRGSGGLLKFYWPLKSIVNREKCWKDLKKRFPRFQVDEGKFVFLMKKVLS